MSKINASTFIQKMNSDVTLQHKLEKLGNIDIESLVNFAAQQGYIFSAQDWHEAIESSLGELDENALDQVAGGINPQPLPPDFTGVLSKITNKESREDNKI
ncbi:MAG: Nif11-like leader peptide family natural product precursor [Chloroflexi bacterium]|uniref:Nif11-like leader peptide family natural product n=1 Tax=Candidatus Chlorohelix allophototropha TaxID=3003348 RepID=A0A8T7LXC6_9CHLR|nr:Nif11-like leader peptide family natural product precursor [Chloroflexota bacterium]WJW65997.1 Nif11-like leader peptide family natural product precursor [Chloroflexota bacterium L227-S17]